MSRLFASQDRVRSWVRVAFRYGNIQRPGVHGGRPARGSWCGGEPGRSVPGEHVAGVLLGCLRDLGSSQRKQGADP